MSRMKTVSYKTQSLLRNDLIPLSITNDPPFHYNWHQLGTTKDQLAVRIQFSDSTGAIVNNRLSSISKEIVSLSFQTSALKGFFERIMHL